MIDRLIALGFTVGISHRVKEGSHGILDGLAVFYTADTDIVAVIASWYDIVKLWS